MAAAGPNKWLLLIHQIPPKPNALRVKIWRRLQQVGAVAIKQSVYAMPNSDQSREDLNWMLKEIVEGGGDGCICEARFVEGLSDEQVIALFNKARLSDYDKLIQEANTLFIKWSSGASDPRNPATKAASQLSRLQRRLEAILAIDFFETPEHAAAELQFKELENLLHGASVSGTATENEFSELQGKFWVTRRNIFVDRIACGWLIRRFIDKKAVFQFVEGPQHSLQSNEIRFDMYDAEYSHEGNLCTFEVMIQRLQIEDHALGPMAEVVHDIDLKDQKFGRSETDGFNALLTGLVSAYPDDDQRMAEGFRLFDSLYVFYQRQKRK